jgi:prepilin peptidase CpaA
MGLTLPPPGVQAVLISLVIGAAVFDVRYRRIPNWISVGGAAIGLLLNAFLVGRGSQVFSMAGLVFALKGLVAGFGLYFVLYLLHAMGAGDVKLMGAVGALVGWRDWIGIFILTAILGGVAAIALSVIRKRLGKTLWNVSFILSEMKSGRPAYLGNEELDLRSKKGASLPHGTVIAVATLLFIAMSAYYTR